MLVMLNRLFIFEAENKSTHFSTHQMTKGNQMTNSQK